MAYFTATLPALLTVVKNASTLPTSTGDGESAARATVGQLWPRLG